MIEFVSYLGKFLVQNDGGTIPFFGLGELTTNQFFYIAIGVAVFLIGIMIVCVAVKSVASVLATVPLIGLIIIAAAVIIAFFTNIAKIVNTILLMAAIAIGVIGLLLLYKSRKQEKNIDNKVKKIGRNVENLLNNVKNKEARVNIISNRTDDLNNQIGNIGKSIEEASEEEKKR
ncbi:MAG: hypothetical protein DRN08_07895 [Thermoplasmata archaeon]|nr:MAG: hypothetical protein DRN08_07895 [Thermoplasmata archaeon]RLG01997.1 MAG: hypothetical protein DRN58_00505 [Thermococci archaeon]